jgi:hypothetical protein
VAVEKKVERGSKGGTTVSFVPTLQLKSGNGGGVALRKFTSESRARAFAEWLSGRLQLASPALPREE